MSFEVGTDVPKKGDVVGGKYRVVRVASAGRKTVVLDAHDDLLDRPAAVAIMRVGVTTPEQIARFLEHARAVARVRSDHAARVLDIGEMADGCPFVAMDQLFGDDVAQLLAEEGPLDPEVAVDLALQALEALAAAHAVGVLHREIQPANLLVTSPRGARPVLKVLDFRGTQPMAAPSAYTAPEQLLNPDVLDPRSDVWSVGAVLYELLTGVAPFAGESPAALSAAILAASPRDLAELRWEVPEGLSEVVMRCLRREPARRHADVDDLAVALAPFGSGARASCVARAQEALRRESGGGAGSISAQIVVPVASPAAPSPASGWREPQTTLSSFPPVAPGTPMLPPPLPPARPARWTRTATLVAATFAVLGLAGTLSTRALGRRHAGMASPPAPPAVTAVPVAAPEPSSAPSAAASAPGDAESTPVDAVTAPSASPSAGPTGPGTRPALFHTPTRRQLLQSRQ